MHTLDTIRAEVTELRKKVDKPPKDVWDKVTAVSGLASGLAVALFGFYATNVYNRRQRQSEENRKDRELLIAQIQTVEKFIPHLSSKDETVKSGALVAISALGNEELAIKLAKAFGGPGATSALTSIAATAGPQEAASAERALQEHQRHIAESFSRAVEQLGSDKVEVRLGSIYSLEQISRERSTHCGRFPHDTGRAAVDRGCVKTLKSQQGGELFSLLPFLQSSPQR